MMRAYLEVPRQRKGHVWRCYLGIASDDWGTTRMTLWVHSESLGLWSFSIVRNSKYLKTRRFGNWMFPSSGDGANLNYGIGLYLEFRTMDQVQKPQWFWGTSWLFRSCWNSPLRENKFNSCGTDSKHWAVITSTSFSGGPQFKSRHSNRLLRLIVFWVFSVLADRLCGLVVRVLGYRSGGPGSIPGTTRKKK
jgi:hypothetical protein